MGPDVRAMSEVEFTAYLHWLLAQDGAEPRIVTVPLFDLAIDVVLPET